jgi:pimeloyl-ACP methyl ester carboxylesterase/DNA-binding CsgD family transcriptional regulator
MALSSQQIRFCTSRDGTRVAFATSGSGPPLVKALHLASHLESDPEHPVWGPWMSEIARGRTLVRYDPRGFGLSDRSVTDFTLARHIDDLAAVIDAAGLDRFALIGFAGGAALSVHYAVIAPARVTHLVLQGAFLLGRLARSQTAEQAAEAEMLLQLISLGWGQDDPAFRQFYTSQYIPDGTIEQFRSFNESLRRAASPENASRLLRALQSCDLRKIAPLVTCPTLVLHSIEDRRVPMEQGRALAAAIADARFVPLNSRNHYPLPHEPAWTNFIEELNAFLPAAAPAPPHPGLALLGGLTRRELQVLELVAQGAGNATIGERLGIGEKTVRNNVSAILGKLDVHTRAEAIVRARDAGFGLEARP